jgi:hypothetical protein
MHAFSRLSFQGNARLSATYMAMTSGAVVDQRERSARFLRDVDSDDDMW